MKEKLLLVDDEADFLDVLSEFLRDEGYEVAIAHDAKEALTILGARPVDLLLSDINMPGMKGFELIKEACRLYPSLKCALITAYDVRDYLYMAKHYNIGNIITKTTPFNFDEVKLLVKNILTEDVFGLDHYMSGAVEETRVRSTNEIENVIKQIVGGMPDLRHKRKFRQVLNEIIVNAVYYGAKSERGRPERLLAAGGEPVVRGGDRYPVGPPTPKRPGSRCATQKGVLTKEEVLYWLERNATRGEDGVSVGLLDEHGKGLFISRETIDRFIVNIKARGTPRKS